MAFLIVLIIVVISAVILSSDCLDSGTEVPVTPKVPITPDMEIAKALLISSMKVNLRRLMNFLTRMWLKAYLLINSMKHGMI